MQQAKPPLQASSPNLDIKPYLRRIELEREKVPSFEEYPFDIPAVRSLAALEFHPDVTFLVGENGSGKSTLVEAVAALMGFNSEGGSRNFNFCTRETHSDLHKCLKPVMGYKKPADGFFLRAESFYNAATYIDEVEAEGSYGGKSLHARSHGESFLALLANRFRGRGLYLLDEPEAALSPSRQLSALALIHRLVLLDSQFIIATHSPILMAYPRARIILLADSGMREVAYRDTEHFKVTRDFMDRTDDMLQILMEED